MQCAWVPLRVLLSLGLKAVPGETTLHRVLLMRALRRRLACLSAGWDRGWGQGGLAQRMKGLLPCKPLERICNRDA